MKKIILTILFLQTIGSFAQSKLELSLNEAMDYALKNRPDLKNAHLKEDLAENEEQKLYSLIFPKVTTSFDLRDNTQLQTNIIPAGAFGSTEARKVQFGAKYNTTLGLDVQQPVFDPTFNAVRKGAKLNIDAEKLAITKAETDVKYQVAQDYYSIILNKVKRDVSNINMQRNEKYYFEAKNKYENGTILKTDLDRFKIDFLNAKVGYEREENSYYLAKSRILSTIGADPSSDLILKDSSTLLQLAQQPSGYSINPENRIEYKQESNALLASSYNIKRYKMDALPRVSLYGYYGTQALRNEFDMFNSAFYWNRFNYIGLKVNFTIFDGALRRNNLDQAKIQSKINQNNLENWKRLIVFEQHSAGLNLKNASSSLTIAKENLEQANEILKVNQARFKEGNITYAELINAEKTLADAQANYITSIYDYLLAQLNNQKSQSGL